MALFLAINATSVTLMIPSGVIAIRAQLLGGSDPMAGSIWIATLIATTCSTAAAVAVSLGLQRVPFFAARPLGHEASVPAPPSDLPDVMLPEAPKASGSRSVIGSVLIGAVVLAVAAAAIAQAIQAARADDFGAFGKRLGTTWPLPLLLFSMVAYGLRARVRVYEAAVEGGKEALQVALRIAPYLVTLLAAIAMFRASGALDSLIGLIDPLTARLGVPGEVLPLMLIKPLSGSGAIAVLRDTLASAGPISYAGFLASAVNGSTETTFYVLTLYLGVIGVKDSRYILPACLLGDVAGYAGAVIATRLLYSGPV
jgi:spore maturation protein SpmB